MLIIIFQKKNIQIPLNTKHICNRENLESFAYDRIFLKTKMSKKSLDKSIPTINERLGIYTTSLIVFIRLKLDFKHSFFNLLKVTCVHRENYWNTIERRLANMTSKEKIS